MLVPSPIKWRKRLHVKCSMFAHYLLPQFWTDFPNCFCVQRASTEPFPRASLRKRLMLFSIEPMASIGDVSTAIYASVGPCYAPPNPTYPPSAKCPLFLRQRVSDVYMLQHSSPSYLRWNRIQVLPLHTNVADK